MTTEEKITAYFESIPEKNRLDLMMLHKLILSHFPGHKLWYEDGKNAEGKVVSNPNIGYGQYTIHYANGSQREFFQIGISANTAGISVYIMGIADKHYLNTHFGSRIGKAKITGYCIKFKSINDIDLAVLQQAIEFGLAATS